MTWTAARTWVDNELVTAAIANQHIRDNLLALKDPPTASYLFNEGADYTTTSTSFVDVDATDLALTIVTTGGDVFVTFFGVVNLSANSLLVRFDVTVDGVAVAGDDGLIAWHNGTTGNTIHAPIGFGVWVRSLAAGSHTFKLRWRMGGAGTATLYAGAGTAGFDYHPQFAVREVS